MQTVCSLLKRNAQYGAKLITFVSAFVLLSLAQCALPNEADAQVLDAGLYIVIVHGDSVDYIAVDTIAIRSFLRRLAQVDDSASSGASGMSLAAFRDSINHIMTSTTGRVMHYSNLQPGTADDQVLITASGAAMWTSTPNVPRSHSHVFYLGSSISPHAATDTASNKHLLYATQLGREYPVGQGTVWSGLRVNVYARGGDATSGYGSYSSTMTATGSGAAAIAAGDKLVMRFFPKLGTGTDKILKLYRVPDGAHVIGTGINLIYGEEIASVTIPAAKFPLTTTCNLEATLSYQVK